METIKHPQLLVLLTVLSVLFSQALALPLSEAEALRNVRHADGVSNNDFSSLLDQLSANIYPESMIEKRDSSKGQVASDHQTANAQFNDEYHKFIQRMGTKKQAKKAPSKNAQEHETSNVKKS